MILSTEDRRLLSQAAARAKQQDEDEVLTSKRIAELRQTLGLDLTTAILHERIARQSATAEFLRAAHDARAATKLNVDLVGVVPGAFHREHTHTGADGARVLEIARQMGCEACVIPTASFGGLDANARIVSDWLETRRERRVALLSLSKGGAEIKRALALPGAARAFAGVVSWISLSGMVQGTPLIAWLRERPLRWWGVRMWLWWKRHGIQAMNDLHHRSEELAADWPTMPAQLRVVHVYGFPLRRHLVHRWAFRGYARLASLGPNDGGGILLSDLLRLPGVVCPIWGVDHYLAPRWDLTPLLRGIIVAATAEPPPHDPVTG